MALLSDTGFMRTRRMMELALNNLPWLKTEAYRVPAPTQTLPAPARYQFSRMPEATPPSPSGTSALRKPRILAVDSAPTTPLLTRIMVQECVIQTVSSAAQILSSALHPEPRPDLIVLDVVANNNEGLDICRQLKADETTHSVPVLLITDRDHAEDEAQALRLGAEECIAHPFCLDVFEARIRHQIELKRKNDLLEHYANQDSLTDLANRRCFDLVLDAEWRRAMRDGQCLSLVMVDVDYFKQFNDLYGHREGDHCLRRVAKAMRHALTRPADLLARYGGEEFTVILPGTSLEGARWIGERLREAVGALQIPQQRPDGARHVTISVGYASAYPSPNQTCYSLLQKADEQLYLAKHSGRNCVR
jgi:diguanylate cyclase (GGDEF)-like protein